ncbi:hypothetical protein F4680DRAFT_464808 [Xylaria scruposa]|nr:hypothetical protein F4680DRAFT_464808 [Xylaria scruposa]
MAPQISSLTQQKRKDFYIPPELILMIFEQVPGTDWPEMWFSMRAVCRMWKVEIEKLFMERYLKEIKLWAGPRCGGMYWFTIKAVPGERAIAELEGGVMLLQWDSLLNNELLQTDTMLLASGPGVGISQTTRLAPLVGLKIDTEGNRILIQWLPMVNELFHRICSQKKIAS